MAVSRRRVSAGRLGERRQQDRSPAWFQLAAGLLACRPGIRVKVTVAGPHACAGTGPAMPPTSLPAGSPTRCRDCPNPASPASAAGTSSAFPGMPATGPGGMRRRPRHRAIAGYRPPPWRRVGDGDGHVGGAAL